MGRLGLRVGTEFIVPDGIFASKRLFALCALAPLIAGCGASTPDLLSKDAQWFQRSGRVFIRNVSIETPPLTPEKAVMPDELVSADGACPGMAPGPGDANALTGGTAGAPPPTGGTVALGHTECDVIRGIGAPDNVGLSNNPRGERVALVTYSRGPRAGIYTFTGGRLSSIERGPEPVAQPKAAKPKPAKKKPAAT